MFPTLLILAGLAALLAIAGIIPNGFAPLQDELLILQAAATLTTTQNGTALDMGAGFSPGGGGFPVQAAINATVVKVSAGNESYTFKMQDSPDNATWTDRTPPVVFAAPGALPDMIPVQGFITARYARLVVTIAGTAPTITFDNVYLNPMTVA